MDKKLIISIILSILTFWGFQYFMSKKTPGQDTFIGGSASVAPAEDALGGSIKIPVSGDLLKPLNLDVDFAVDQLALEERYATVDTNLIKAVISSRGATMIELDFKEHNGKNKSPIKTIEQKKTAEDVNQQEGCFLVALNEKTPLNYELVEQYKKDTKEYVVYRTQTADWDIYKTYAFAENSYRVDLTLGFEPKREAAESIKPRLFFSAPYMNELAENDTLTTFMFNERQKTIEKKALDSEEFNSEKPTVWYWRGKQVFFGAYDRYFAHALVKDSSHFVQRAYFKPVDGNGLNYLNKFVMPILEGPAVTDKKEWTMSFYMGPKVYDHLAAVDTALPDILNFGWFSSLCKLLLQLLGWLMSYIGNFGLAIVVLAIALRLPITPLAVYGRIQTEKYQKHQPVIARIRAKFKNDLQMQHQEVMRYHEEHNLSQFGHVMGCLPVLLQVPIMYSLYNILGSALSLYQAPFYGWIVDLSAKDPFYILPILMGISMLWSQLLMPADGKQRTMMMFMSLVMAVISANWAAGLVLYWVVSNFLTVGEDYLRKIVARA